MKANRTLTFLGWLGLGILAIVVLIGVILILLVQPVLAQPPDLSSLFPVTFPAVEGGFGMQFSTSDPAVLAALGSPEELAHVEPTAWQALNYFYGLYNRATGIGLFPLPPPTG